MTPKQYLINFTSLVKWDVEKLIAVAEAGEVAQAQRLRGLDNIYATPTQSLALPVPTPSSGIISAHSGSGVASMFGSGSGSEAGSALPSSRLYGNPFLEQHTPEVAKCAVPMAMVLIAAAEFVGSILSEPSIWDVGNKFDLAIKKFFEYAEFPLDVTEKNVLRQSFRNGMAHNFMMQGEDVSIDYQQRFKSVNRLLFMEGRQTVLNVNKLHEIVSNVFDKIIVDESVHPTIILSVQAYEKEGKNAKKTANFLAEFKEYDATRPIN